MTTLLTYAIIYLLVGALLTLVAVRRWPEEFTGRHNEGVWIPLFLMWPVALFGGLCYLLITGGTAIIEWYANVPPEDDEG